jgi:hypothetical protein
MDVRQNFTHIHALEFTQFKVMLGSIACFNEMFDLGGLHDPRINHVVAGQPKSIIAENTWSP